MRYLGLGRKIIYNPSKPYTQSVKIILYTTLNSSVQKTKFGNGILHMWNQVSPIKNLDFGAFEILEVRMMDPHYAYKTMGSLGHSIRLANISYHLQHTLVSPPVPPFAAS